jgi:tRNA threonylcarbamoyladenosine biosynthesis protein TsaE
MKTTTRPHTLTYETHSAEETMEAGRKIASVLRPPVLLILRGDLGAGKTTLVKGIVDAYGGADPSEVTSPTFTLLHEYEGRQEGKEILLCHLDLYRVEDERQLASIGMDEMPAENAIVLVEWGEKFAGLMRRSAGEIVLESMGGDRRRITLTFF